MLEQVKKLVEAGCKGIVKDHVALADVVTRERKDIYLVSDAECPTYSFLMILSEKKSEKNNHKRLGYYSPVIEQMPASPVSLDGIFSVKKHHAGGYEVVYLWSNSAIEATILYNLGLRVWKKIVSDRGDSPTVNSVLSKLKKLDGSFQDKEYRIRKEMETLPYGIDVKMISLGTPGTQDLQVDDPGYAIAGKIAEVNRDLYDRHDSAFDEMHRIAKLFGLTLPTSPAEWENKSSSR
jgi:hypothetical protein